MKRLQVVLALALFVLFATRAQAQGTAAFSAGSPTKGTLLQTINVQGMSMTLQNYTFTGAAQVQFVQVGGGPVILNTLSLRVNGMNGNWPPMGVGVDVGGPTGTPLTSGTMYTVTVQVQVQATGAFREDDMGRQRSRNSDCELVRAHAQVGRGVDRN
jgi:hypothetical protein